jgi:hypothetical protein
MYFFFSILKHRQSELNAEHERLSINQKFARIEDGNGTDSGVLSKTQSPNHVNTLTTNSTNKISGELSPEARTLLSNPTETFDVIHANKDLKYISQYLPNNKCSENVDHHDHENEKEHLHRHSTKSKQNASISMSVLPDAKSTSMLKN